MTSSRIAWRFSPQAGDLPGEGDEIDGEQLGQLAAANARRPAIVFTHKPPTVANLKHLQAAVDRGLHINLSADSLAEADELARTGLSVVTILSSEYGRRDGEELSAYRARRRGLPSHTPGGLRIAICPATYLDVTCVECQVCSRARVNGTVMGFPAHANRSASVDAVFTASESGPAPLLAASLRNGKLALGGYEQQIEDDGLSYAIKAAHI